MRGRHSATRGSRPAERFTPTRDAGGRRGWHTGIQYGSGGRLRGVRRLPPGGGLGAHSFNKGYISPNNTPRAKTDFVNTKGNILIRELRSIEATGVSEEERAEAWEMTIFFDTDHQHRGRSIGKPERETKADTSGSGGRRLAATGQRADRQHGSRKKKTSFSKDPNRNRQGTGEASASMRYRRIVATRYSRH